MAAPLLGVPADSPLAVVLDRLAGAGRRLHRSGKGWAARCPAHDDHRASLVINEGDVQPVVLYCHAGCTPAAIVAALGLAERDLCAPDRSLAPTPSPRTLSFEERTECTYDYVDEAGALLFQAVRLHSPKDFRQRQPTAGGGWRWTTDGVRRVLYHLPEVLEAVALERTVYLCEGERDADALRARRLVATTNPMGAGKWRDDYTAALAGAHVVILPDNDAPGRQHARTVAVALAPVAASVRVLELPGVPEKGDVSDWLAAGGAVAELDALPELALAAVDAAAGASVPSAETPTADELVLDPRDPMPSARLFRARHFEVDGLQTLYYQGGEFYAWTGTHYAVREEAAMRSLVWHFAEAAKRPGRGGAMVPFQPTTTSVSGVLDAVKAITVLAADTPVPRWLDATPDDPPATELVALRNGILHVPTRRVRTPTPRLYTQHALDFDLPDGTAPEPTAWLDFLAELWPDDDGAVSTLQEIMGYLLLPNTRQQKAFLLVGPKRSGKGTVGRVITALLGHRNVCAPTLSSLASPFGKQALIGKLLALVSDARLSSRADQSAIAEAILTVSGEDTVTVDRKHLPAWTGRLPTRFMLLTNELPRLADASGALASRFVVLTLRASFYGCEDVQLTDRLLAERAGIFAWALEGWDRLHARGHFVQPESAHEAIRELENLSSPITAFLRDRCRVEAGRMVECKRLYEAWKTWCDAEGRDHYGTAQTFGRDLRAAVPGLRIAQPRWEGSQVRAYEGIGLDSSGEAR